MMGNTWQYHTEIVWEEDEAGTTVYVTSMMGSEILILEGSATAIWQTLPGLDTQTLIAELASGFQISAESIRHDVESFLRDLASRGLIYETQT